jgi:hypothetical protein
MGFNYNKTGNLERDGLSEVGVEEG